jgi:hypothetical protein
MLKNDPILIFALLYIYLIIFLLCELDDIHYLYIHLILHLHLNHLMLNLENVLFSHCNIFAFFFLFFFEVLIFFLVIFYLVVVFYLFFDFLYFDFEILLILLIIILFLFLLLVLVMFLLGLGLEKLKNYVNFLVLLLFCHRLMIVFFAFYENVLFKFYFMLDLFYIFTFIFSFSIHF